MSDDKPGASTPKSHSEQTTPERGLADDEALQATGATCRNCGAPLAGRYCHDCGQRRLPRLRLRDLGRRFLRTILEIENLGGGVWRTLADGARDPGALARKYIEGERQQVINPVSYFLIAATLAFLAFGLLEGEYIRMQADQIRAQWAAVGVSPDQVFAEGSPFREQLGWTSAEDLAGGVFGVLRQVKTYFGLVILLLAAGVLRGLFSGKTYAELVVFELYTVAQVNLFEAVLIPVLGSWSPTAAFAAGPLLLLFLHAVAGSSFFGKGWKGWLLPPLAIAAALIGVVVIVSIGGFVGGFTWGLLSDM
jgi:hypothetical protein